MNGDRDHVPEGDARGARGRAFAFGPFRLMPARQLLLRDGLPVHLGSRALDILTMLVMRSGELVSRDDLITAAWPQTNVHESNLKVTMCGLRRALGDRREQPNFVATVAGRGYRFVADVAACIAEGPGEPFPSHPAPSCKFPPAPQIVGRETAITAITDALDQGRQVTVAGTAGVGKTTVAVAAAQLFGTRCQDGTCFVDLTAIADPSLVPSALVTALGLRGSPEDALAAVLDYLGARDMMLVLDNCEHVLAAVIFFARRFHAAGGRSRLLVTSRERLDTPGEMLLLLEPLPCPDPDATLSAAQAMCFPSVDLFVARAREWAGYRLVDADCAAVVKICSALEGLPLALELAAAQANAHTMQDLLALLGAHSRFHNRNAGAAPARQETLQAAIDWSVRLLSHNEVTIFSLISVFSDSFGMEDVVAIAVPAGLLPGDVVTGLGSLVAKSLLTARVHGAGVHYRLLDSTRRYAAERRDADGIGLMAQRTHAHRMLAIFEQAEEEWNWRGISAWTEHYRSRLSDLRAALSWSFGDGADPGLGIRLTAAALPLWFEISLMREAEERVEHALREAQITPCDELVKAKLACFLGWSMLYARRPGPRSEQIWLAAIAYAERADDIGYQLRARVSYAFFLLQVGQVGRALDCLREFTRLSEQHRDWCLGPEGERLVALALAHRGELAASGQMLEQLAARYVRVERRSRMAGFQVDRYIGIRCYLPFVAWLGGKADDAVASARDAVEAAGALGHLVSQSNALGLAALLVSFWVGDEDALVRYTAQLQSNLMRENMGLWKPVQRFFGAVLADLNGDPHGVAAMRASIDDMVDHGFSMRVGMYLGILAEALARRARLDEARTTIAAALHHSANQDERWCRAELLRIEATIHRSDGEVQPALLLFHAALEEARATGAASFELRIASDLADHYIGVGRCDDALAILGPVYQRMQQGFATKDLIAAAQLLARARLAEAHPAMRAWSSLR